MTKHIYFACIILFMSILLFIFRYVIKLKNKKQLHKIFIGEISSLIICNLGYLLVVGADIFFNYKSIVFEFVVFGGATLASAFWLLTVLCYTKGYVKFEYKYVILFVPLLFTNIILWTNDYHSLFYKGYGLGDKYVFGMGFYIGMFFTWLNILTGIIKLTLFSIKNSKFFLKQSTLLMWGTIVPMLFSASWVIGSAINNETLKFNSYYDLSPITLSVMAICFAIAILKFDFLDVIPIALQQVVDCISDSFAIINIDLELIDYNKSFEDKIMGKEKPQRKENIINILKGKQFLAEDEDNQLRTLIENAINSKKTVMSDKDIEKSNRVFNVEISPIFSKTKCLGIIILFKDITELKKSQNALIEQERLASLGQLAGGMAHDINTPISAIMGGIDFLKGKHEYTDRELRMIEIMKASGEKIIEIVNSVRNQIRNVHEDQNIEFNISDVLDNLHILLNNELEKNNCKLAILNKENVSLHGDMGKIVQVIMNIVINSIQAYSPNGGEIKLDTYIEEHNLIISIEDNAGGIPEKISKGIFKEILTTKGTKGTGFGLYFSLSTIKANFNGNITFETEENKGTKFYISVPLTR